VNDSWKKDFGRLAILLSASSVLGLAANAISPHPVPLLSSDGPGAWPDLAPRMTLSRLGSEIRSGRLFLLLDVRSEEAFRQGHAAGALHAPATAFLDAYRHLSLGTLLQAADGVVVLCESAECPSSDRVAHLLKGLGHQNVYVLEGGWKAYHGSNLEK
jgi:rhodanese-related sulfurtransferase